MKTTWQLITILVSTQIWALSSSAMNFCYQNPAIKKIESNIEKIHQKKLKVCQNFSKFEGNLPYPLAYDPENFEYWTLASADTSGRHWTSSQPHREVKASNRLRVVQAYQELCAPIPLEKIKSRFFRELMNFDSQCSTTDPEAFLLKVSGYFLPQGKISASQRDRISEDENLKSYFFPHIKTAFFGYMDPQRGGVSTFERRPHEDPYFIPHEIEFLIQSRSKILRGLEEKLQMWESYSTLRSRQDVGNGRAEESQFLNPNELSFFSQNPQRLPQYLHQMREEISVKRQNINSLKEQLKNPWLHQASLGLSKELHELEFLQLSLALQMKTSHP